MKLLSNECWSQHWFRLWLGAVWQQAITWSVDPDLCHHMASPDHNDRAANQYGTSVFCTDFTCKIREYEFGLQNTEIELCQFCHLRYYCQNKAYLFWVANQSRFVVFYALKPSNTSLITKTLILLSSTCGSNQVEDKTKFWAGTYYWTGTKFRGAGSKFWSAKSRVRLAGVTENAGRTCRKLSGIKRFFASRE